VPPVIAQVTHQPVRNLASPFAAVTAQYLLDKRIAGRVFLGELTRAGAFRTRFFR
jgi:hypothetical protein